MSPRRSGRCSIQYSRRDFIAGSLSNAPTPFFGAKVCSGALVPRNIATRKRQEVRSCRSPEDNNKRRPSATKNASTPGNLNITNHLPNDRIRVDPAQGRLERQVTTRRERFDRKRLRLVGHDAHAFKALSRR